MFIRAAQTTTRTNGNSLPALRTQRFQPHRQGTVKTQPQEDWSATWEKCLDCHVSLKSTWTINFQAQQTNQVNPKRLCSRNSTTIGSCSLTADSSPANLRLRIGWEGQEQRLNCAVILPYRLVGMLWISTVSALLGSVISSVEQCLVIQGELVSSSGSLYIWVQEEHKSLATLLPKRWQTDFGSGDRNLLLTRLLACYRISLHLQFITR